MNKERRNFVKVIGVTTGIILSASFASASIDNNPNKNIVNNYWQGHNKNEQDIRIKLISYAILAPNPHNTQAWLIDLKDDDSIDLYVDKSRVLPQTDPFFRQIHIGQGTFIENLNISASYFGYKTEIIYFSNGEYDNKTIQNKAIASIQLIKDNKIKKDVINLRKIAIEAMSIENLDKKRDLETINMFRFNDEEIKKYRDGFGFSQNGKSGILKFILEKFFISREEAEQDPSSFAKEGLKITENQANSTQTFAWLTTKNNNRIEQVKIGRTYARLNLLATSLGLVMHPMSQVLQEYSDMTKLQNEFLNLTNTTTNNTVQMFFRIGIAQNTEHSPRREIKDILI